MIRVMISFSVAVLLGLVTLGQATNHTTTPGAEASGVAPNKMQDAL